MSRELISIDPAALKQLEEFEFPGNVRELENMIERAIVIGNGKEIRLKDLPLGKERSNTSIESLAANAPETMFGLIEFDNDPYGMVRKFRVAVGEDMEYTHPCPNYRSY